MASPVDAPLSLDALILNATNPLVRHEDPNAVQAVVQAVLRDAAAPTTAVRILAHKIHSPQESEAMKALSVLQACIINCGSPFHSEIGKFRFLNEMIKLVSPKYSGNHTPAAIKSRVLELLFCWMTDLSQEPKIAEAYNMLKKQGVVKDDPVYIGPLRVTPAPRPASSSSIEDRERSQQLQRLLQSKRPEDLDRANALIKAMVRDDQRRLEQTTHAAMEVEMARNNIKVLDEMLSEHEQRGGCDSGHVALMAELEQTCGTLRNTLYHTIAQCADTNADVGELIAVNEELSRVMGRYKVVVEGKKGTGGEVSKGNGHQLLENGVAGDGAAAETEPSGDMLLDLSSPSPTPVVSAATADLLHQQLHSLGLDDGGGSAGTKTCTKTTSSVATTTAPSAPPLTTTSNSASLLEEMGSGPLFNSSSLGGDVISNPRLAPPLMPHSKVDPMQDAMPREHVEWSEEGVRVAREPPTPTHLWRGSLPRLASGGLGIYIRRTGSPFRILPPAFDRATSPLDRSRPQSGSDTKGPPANPLDDLDILSTSLLQSALPPNTATSGPRFRQPEKLSINQLKQRQTQAPAASSAASKPSSSILGLVSTESLLSSAEVLPYSREAIVSRSQSGLIIDNSESCASNKSDVNSNQNQINVLSNVNDVKSDGLVDGGSCLPSGGGGSLTYISAEKDNLRYSKRIASGSSSDDSLDVCIALDTIATKVNPSTSSSDNSVDQSVTCDLLGNSDRSSSSVRSGQASTGVSSSSGEVAPVDVSSFPANGLSSILAPSGGRASKAASSLSNAQFLEVKPLNDIKVSIENIQPSDRSPLILLETGTVSTSLHHTSNSPRPDVSVFVVTTTSRSPATLHHYVMQAVVPRACKVRLLPPSSTSLPQYSPFLPPPAVTQIMLVANPNEVNVSLKLMLSYSVNDEPITEMAELDNLEL